MSAYIAWWDILAALGIVMLLALIRWDLHVQARRDAWWEGVQCWRTAERIRWGAAAEAAPVAETGRNV